MTPLRKKNIISIASLLILSVLFVFFIISPIFSDIKEISRSLPLKKQELAELEKKIENLNKFKNTLSEISPNVEKISNLFINLRAPIEFREFLEEIAQDSKVSLEISPAPLSQAANADPWLFNLLYLDIAGPFSNFSNFLEKLESAPYLVEVQNFNIAAEAKSSQFEQFYLGDIKTKILIKAYAR